MVHGTPTQEAFAFRRSHHSKREAPVNKEELQKIEGYMRRLFSNGAIKVTARPKKTDSAEVYIGDEFIGVVFLDDEDGDRSFSFNMSILDTDLEEGDDD
jgi:Protein of unknown function (DUF3126)